MLVCKAGEPVYSPEVGNPLTNKHGCGQSTWKIVFTEAAGGKKVGGGGAYFSGLITKLLIFYGLIKC